MARNPVERAESASRGETATLLVGPGYVVTPEEVLSEGGVLYLYGPFMRGHAHTAPSNASFDDSLRARDPAWGVRDVDDVTREAEKNGLARVEIVEMPANNLSVVFRRA